MKKKKYITKQEVKAIPSGWLNHLYNQYGNTTRELNYKKRGTIYLTSHINS